MSTEDPDNTIEAVRDDLDNYGGHLRVFIESRDGNLFEVGEIVARDNWRGETIVTIAVGSKFREDQDD